MIEKVSWTKLFAHKPGPLVCGIVNVTPDSFFDGGLFLQAEQAIEHGLSLVEQGADVLDIGGESTRPGADKVGLSEEVKRVIPVIQGIRKTCSIPISIDTMKANVAEAAIDSGADIWNDVSALTDDKTSVKMAAKLECPLILMHKKGSPKTMQARPKYENVVDEVIEYLQTRIKTLKQAGIYADKIMVDPGIGFGKTLTHNLQLMAALSKISEATACPVLLGASRKSFIAKMDKTAKTDARIGGSLASVATAFLQDVAMVRVHDVAQTVQMLTVLRGIQQAGEAP